MYKMTMVCGHIEELTDDQWERARWGTVFSLSDLNADGTYHSNRHCVPCQDDRERGFARVDREEEETGHIVYGDE